ncbi:MAG: nicotinate-nucleotide adenylyltransferase [Deltaproteobacteria bacterium]|nr:nicotinate-nucleotide adenylyltransferase [Deltaproteobacteria bacterium]
MRLGILGGTFDPIHLGHLRLAEEVREGFSLDKVYLLPASSPPHKDGKIVTPFHHRFKMTEAAVEGSPYLIAFDLEARRQGFSYSINTLKEFHRLYPPRPELFFVIGTDAFQEIETWKNYRELFNYAHFVVVRRPGIPAEDMIERLRSLGLPFRKEDEGRFVGPSGYELIYLEATLMDISSTGIREKVAAGKSIRYLVPDSVRCYILQYGLYKTYGIS